MLTGEDCLHFIRGFADTMSRVLGVAYKPKVLLADARATLPSLLSPLQVSRRASSGV